MPTTSARTYQITASPIRQMIQLVEANKDITRLEVGEPHFPTPEPIVRAAQRALDEGWTRYTGSSGILALRQALAQYDAPKLGRTPDPAREVCVTVGATNGLFLACLAIVNPGDEVLVPDPGWPQYQGIVRLAGGVPVPYVLDARRGFHVDQESVVARLSARTRLILVNSPHNPTGAVLDADELDFFARLARERDLWVITDEVYEHVIFDGLRHASIAALPGMAERTVVVGAFSKTFAMTGWRLGHLVGPPAVVEPAMALQGFINTCPNAATQRAGLAALELPAETVDGMVKEFQGNRDVFAAELAGLPNARFVLPRGTFYMFVDFGHYGVPDGELARHFLGVARVSSIPGSGFGAQGRGFLRFSFAGAAANIRSAVGRLREALATLPPELRDRAGR